MDRPFREFLPYAAAEQERVKAAPTLEDGEDGESLFFVSCVPWLSYTALTQPTPTPADSNPRITWGRWHRQGGPDSVAYDAAGQPCFGGRHPHRPVL